MAFHHRGEDKRNARGQGWKNFSIPLFPFPNTAAEGISPTAYFFSLLFSKCALGSLKLL